MTQSNICKKITAMLALYVDNKLDPENSKLVKTHLKSCPECMSKFHILKKLISDLRLAYKELIQESISAEKNRKFYIKEYESFHTNISSYFDNELSLSESLDIKKYLIKFPNARKELNQMYSLHKLIIGSSSTIEKNCGIDCSKRICQELLGPTPIEKKELALKVAAFAGIILLFGFLISTKNPLTQIVKEKGVDFFKKATYVQSYDNYTTIK